jgi:uncharacterized protein (DUF58 family)
VIRLGRSFWWILLLIVISFTLTRLPEVGNNPIYLRLTIALLVILAVNGIWSWLSIADLTLSRTTRNTRKQVGEVFTENFDIVNHSIFPKVWFKVTDESDLPDTNGSRVITWMGGRQTRYYNAHTLLQKRGWFQLGPTILESGDIFGIFLIRKTFYSNTRLLVIPYTVPIQYFPAPFGILPGGRALRQKTLEVTPYAAGVREYEPGDPLKRIHWPTSARKQKLIVKEFEKDPLAEVWIFLDARQSVQCRMEVSERKSLNEIWWVREQREFHLLPDTGEYAITIAASIGKYYINQKREVGLAAAGQTYTILPAERGERQLGKILETLAVLKMEGHMPLWGLISSQIGHLARGSTVILITPSSDEKMMTVVMELVQRGLMPVVILLDRSSFGGQEESSVLEVELTNHGILTFVIHHGDDIKKVLETRKLLDERMIFKRN